MSIRRMMSRGLKVFRSVSEFRNWARKRQLRFRAQSLFAAFLILATALLPLLPYDTVSAATATLVPNGDTTAQWAVPSTGTTHYVLVDEGTIVNTADYVSTGTSGAGAEVEQYSLTTASNIASATQVIVTVNIVSAISSTADTVGFALVVNGVRQSVTTITVTTSNTDYTATFNGTWSQSDVDSMEIYAVRNVVGTGPAASRDDNVRINNAYATLTYTIAPVFNQAGYRWFDHDNGSSYNGGSSWTQAASSPGWTARSEHATLTFNNKMWLFGGTDGSRKNDVHSNSTGTTWTQETAAAGWSARSEHATAVFDSKMWIMGGNDGALKQDVYSTTNGSSSNLATSTAGWSARSGHASVAFAGKLWVLGGNDGSVKNDVWSSSDGITWSQATSGAGWSARSQHTAAVFNNKMWIMGGNDGSVKNDVWSSSDGITWTQETGSAGWSARSGHSTEVFDGKLWVLGGLNGTPTPLNDVWYSSNGATWTQATSSAGWSARSQLSSAVYDNKLWVMGGIDGSSVRKNDVWYALPAAPAAGSALAAQNTAATITDTNSSGRLRMDIGVTSAQVGVREQDFKLQYARRSTACDTSFSGESYIDVDTPIWDQTTSNGGFPARANHVTLVYNNKIWTMGGSVGSGRDNDVWSSSDGITWNEETSNAGWSARSSLSGLVFNNKMWVIGGVEETTNVRKNDVWSSTDGVTWTQETGSAGWTGRSNHSTLVFNNKMWVIGGVEDTSLLYKNDVWSSSDGITWNQETSAAGWSLRAFHASTVFDNKMWLFGGTESTVQKNDVWYSSDGANWYRATAAAAWPIRYGMSVFSLHNKMWLMGGHNASSYNDMWYSTDGANWTEVTPAPGWGARARSNVVMFNNKVWLVAGEVNVVKMNDVWSGSFEALTSTDTMSSPTNSITSHTDDTVEAGDNTRANIKNQTSLQTAKFSNDKSAIAVNEYGMWEFMLNLTYAPNSQPYCFRVVKSSGTTLNTYSNIPEVTKNVTSNVAPDTPTTLDQKKTTNTPITTGTWTNETSVQFTALATDTNSSDTLAICVEKDLLGTAFSNTEDQCGTAVNYTGSAVTPSVTITGLTDGSEYHWQARIKDTAGAYSSWVSFDSNLESARDFAVDSSAPTGGTVYDGSSTGVDATFNDATLTTLAANWSGISSGASGLAGYEYSIGTTAGGTNTKGWTSTGTTTSMSVNTLSLQTSMKYYINVRTTDNAGNVSTPISSDGILVAPSVSFSVSPSTVTFNRLKPSNSYTDTQSTTLTTSTNAYGGYLIRTFTTDLLRAANNQTIPMFNGGTYASPDAWLGGDTGFGYTSDDTSVQGTNKFSPATCAGGGAPPCYVPFTQTAPGDIVADHASGVLGSPVAAEAFTVTYRVTTSASQAATTYNTATVYSVTPIY